MRHGEFGTGPGPPWGWYEGATEHWGGGALRCGGGLPSFSKYYPDQPAGPASGVRRKRDWNPGERISIRPSTTTVGKDGGAGRRGRGLDLKGKPGGKPQQTVADKFEEDEWTARTLGASARGAHLSPSSDVLTPARPASGGGLK